MVDWLSSWFLNPAIMINSLFQPIHGQLGESSPANWSIHGHSSVIRQHPVCERHSFTRILPAVKAFIGKVAVEGLIVNQFRRDVLLMQSKIRDVAITQMNICCSSQRKMAI